MSPYRVDARLSGRHPFEIFTLFLMFITSFPTVLGIAPPPGSINASMPPWMVFTWSCVLLAGSTTALIGIYMRNRGIGLLTEQFGLAVVGVAACIYAGAVAVVGFGGPVSVAIVLGFGVSCLVRWYQIQKAVNGVIHWEQERKADTEGI